MAAIIARVAQHAAGLARNPRYLEFLAGLPAERLAMIHGRTLELLRENPPPARRLAAERVAQEAYAALAQEIDVARAAGLDEAPILARHGISYSAFYHWQRRPHSRAAA